MDIEREIKSAVRSAVMEEINSLGIRAAVREKIEEAGVTQESIRAMVRETVDSYFRSAMDGNVEEKIKAAFDAKTSEMAMTFVKRSVEGLGYYKFQSDIREEISKRTSQIALNDYEIKVTISPRRQE